MKKYTISLLMSYTSDDLEDIGVEHPTDDEVQKWMEGRFEELISSGDFIDTDFKVEEV